MHLLREAEASKTPPAGLVEQLNEAFRRRSSDTTLAAQTFDSWDAPDEHDHGHHDGQHVCHVLLPCRQREMRCPRPRRKAGRRRVNAVPAGRWAVFAHSSRAPRAFLAPPGRAMLLAGPRGHRNYSARSAHRDHRDRGGVR